MDAARQTVERLKEQIRALSAAPRSYLAFLRTGVKELDDLLGGGLPLPTALELWGEAASGRTSLALRAAAAATREKRLSAWVDGPGELYPPAAAAMGVDLQRLLLVRPKAPAQLTWAATQLCRSGAFACVVLDLTHTGVRPSLADGKKLADAAFRGGSLLLMLTPADAPADGMVRLSTRALGVQGFSVEVLRSRSGRQGQVANIPWSSLYPGPSPVYRYVDPHRALECESTRGLVHAPFLRPKSNLERDGHGLYASRPGRDTTLPSLASSLGLSG